MTGRYPLRYGLQTLVIPSAHTYGLATNEWLLQQALKEAGYKTAVVGKWHLGHADPMHVPRERGFDYRAKSLLLQTEMKAMMIRLALPSALPGEEFELNEEP